MKKLKAFVAVLLSTVLMLTCLPIVDIVPAKAATIPTAFQNAQLMNQTLSLSIAGLYRMEAENLPIGSLINRLRSNGSTFIPEGVFKAYAVCSEDDYNWSSPVYTNLSGKINIIKASTTGYENGGYYHNDENYLRYYKNYYCVKKIALVFGSSSSSTITSSDKVYIVNLGTISSPILLSRIYDPSGNEKTVTSSMNPMESGKRTLSLRVNDDSWSENSSARIVFGLADNEKYFPSTGTVKVYRGYYQYASEIPSNAEDITDKVWCGTSKEAKEGIWVYGSNKVPITIVMKQGDQVIDVIGQYVGIEKELEDIDIYDTCLYSGSDSYLNNINKFGNYTTQNGVRIHNMPLELDQTMLGKDRYNLLICIRKGRLKKDLTIQYVDKIAEGIYNNKTEAQNATDLKNRLLYRSDSNGFALEFGKTYYFTIFFKNGSKVNVSFTMKNPNGTSTGPSITMQPSSTTVTSGETAYFSVKASGTGLKYLWQYKEAGKSTWTDWTSKTTSSINVAYAASRDGMSLRCKITDSNGKSITSNIVTLKYSLDQEIIIDATNFPDKNFRSYIESRWDDGDGILDEDEIEEIEWIYCSNRNISSLKGIELFPYLYEVNCYNNNIKSVDFSKNTKLEYIDIRGNQISSINISKNTKLTYLDIGNNPLSSLDISNCPTLKKMFLNCDPENDYGSDVDYCDWDYDEDEYWLTVPSGTNIIIDGTGNVTIVKQPTDYICEYEEMAVFDVGATGKGLKYQWQYKNAGSSSWTTWTSKTSSVISVAYDDSRNGMSVRCIVTDANGNKVTSETATLTYEYPFYIDHQYYGTVSGQSYVVKQANESASFEIGAVGKGINYLWQYKAKGDDTWTDWTSKTTPIISVAYAPYRDGMSFRCKVTNFEGRVLYSREIELRYETTFAITKQPTNSTVDPGSAAKFSVTATGKDLKYLWQYKEAGKSTWVDWTSKTTASISVAYAAYRDGMSLRCVVTDETGAKLTSDVVKLNYNSVFSITAQPVSATVDVNNLAYFEVKAEGKGLKYLWQYKEAGKSSWTDWTSKTTSKISVAYAASRDGMSLRCIVTDSSGNKLTSNTVTLNYNNPLAITGQPASIAVNENSLANFEVKATGKGLKYLWQYKEKGKSTWTDWTSKTTAKISVAYAAYRDGMSFRCVVTDSLGNKLTSNAATLTYNKVFTITSQPLSVTVDQNSAANFEVKAEGKGLKYLWQYKLAGDSSWTDWTSKTTAKISVAYAAYRNNMQLRCIITDSNGRTLTSNVVTLKYNAS